MKPVSKIKNTFVRRAVICVAFPAAVVFLVAALLYFTLRDTVSEFVSDLRRLYPLWCDAKSAWKGQA